MEPEPDRIQREIEILGFRREAAEAAGGEMTTFEFEDAPIEVLHAFWKNVAEYEKAPSTTQREELAEGGVEVRPPGELDDEQLTEELWRLLRAMGERRMFLHCTDHLSDRELYAYLWNEGLNEKVKKPPTDSRWNWNLDLVGSGSEEHIQLWMRYFADEETRERWRKDWPDYEMPPHEDPPYDRDRHMPQPDYSLPPDALPFDDADLDFPEDWEEDTPEA